jgi:hypothetical protein
MVFPMLAKPQARGPRGLGRYIIKPRSFWALKIRGSRNFVLGATIVRRKREADSSAYLAPQGVVTI